MIDEETIFAALRERAPRAVHLGEICATLGVSPKQRDAVRDQLDRLRDLGLVKEMPGQRYRLSKDGRSQMTVHDPNASITGRITLHPKGFGFVAAEDGKGDIFIPPPHVRGAMHTDRVRVEARESPKGREGTVVEILERGLRRLSGVLQAAGRNSWIIPDDPRIPGPLVIAGELPHDARPGMHLVCEIAQYPRHEDEVATVKVLSVLGLQGVTAVEVAKIKLREGIVEDFPAPVTAEAAGIPRVVSDDEILGREDLRPYDLVTIDPPDARDHDDAVWGERLADGKFRLIIAIADVSHYVREGTAIDKEALTRGTSIYLPDRAIPMLPRELSSHMASLVPDENRLVLAVDVTIDEHGHIEQHRYIEGVMCSRGRLTYGAVAHALGLTQDYAGPPDEQERVRKFLPLLQVLYDASRILRAKRMKRGSLDFDLPEARVLLNPETLEPVDVYRARKDPGVRHAYNLVEELMLLANEVVGADFMKRDIPAVYRVHGAPDEEKVAKFSELAAALGYDLDPEAATRPKKLAAFLRQIEGSEHGHALGYLLLRSMQQATYDTTNIGHFGLAAKDYVHFTSPIRRYPDLTVHRTLRALIRNRPNTSQVERNKLQFQAAESSRLERRAMVVERDVVDLYRAILMRDRVGEEFEATISGIAEHGFYAAFDEPFIDSLCPVELMTNDFYELDELGLALFGRKSKRRFGLGDRIAVRIENVSIENRRIIVLPADFEPADPDMAARPVQFAPSKRNGAPSSKGSGGGSRGGDRRDSRRGESRTSRGPGGPGARSKGPRGRSQSNEGSHSKNKKQSKGKHRKRRK